MTSTMKEQLKRRRRGRRHDKTGRSQGVARFLKLEHWMLKTPAWRALSPAPRALYVELAQRYNGSNNGEISMSVREAADLVHIAKDTATKAFNDLEEKGFVRRNQCGSFNWKLRHATTWILTEFPVGETPATKEFARWHGANSETGPELRTRCPRIGTISASRPWNQLLAVPDLGPWALMQAPSRSQTEARI